MDDQKLKIRSAEPEDFRALQVLHMQPAVVRGTMQLPFTSVTTWRKRCSELPEGVRLLVACIDTEIIGCAGLTVPPAMRRRHVGELGLAVHDNWQRQGVGTALLTAVVELADRWLNLMRLELTVYTDNAPAIVLYKKLGFREEGRLISYAYRDGEFVDALAMARVRT